MHQAITVLQCSAVELDQYVQDELTDNPLVEVEPVSMEWQMPWSSTRMGSIRSGSSHSASHRQPPPLEQVVASPQHLADYLEEQVRLNRTVDPAVTEIAVVLIGALDDSGYLQETDTELASWLGVQTEIVQAAVQLLQSCEPVGFAARNLQECLGLQLPTVPEGNRELVSRVLDTGLEDVASGRIVQLARRLQVTPRQLQDAVDALRQLNPRPGSAIGGQRPIYIIPDVIIEKVEGRYIVITNDAAQLMVYLNAAYRPFVSTADAQTQQYLVRKVQAAQWLIRCLEQRRITLHRLAETLVQVQADFFERGPAALKPLTLRHISEQLSVHESTISRAVRNKYIQSPRGLLEMKYFFSAEVSGEDGSASAQAAKHDIRLLVEAEEPTHPLSDEAIGRRMAERGIYVSRRTVAKYREALRIPSSSRRRRFE